MKYLKIQNDGLLDIRLIALMGGTTKDGDKYKIGQFGTGLKYAFAYLFRNNIDFKIFIGEKEVSLYTETEVIGDHTFDIICINNHRTSITTKMGMEWEPWMIIRELWCNALDEGSERREVTTDLVGSEGTTTFYIQYVTDFQKVVDNWHKYFIHEQAPYYETHDYALYPSGEHCAIYKQGVLIHEEKTTRKSIFSYDVRDAEINELREFKGSIDHTISGILCDLPLDQAKYFIENITDESFEAHLDLNWFKKWKQTWRDAIGGRKLLHPELVEELHKRGIEIDKLNVLVVPKNLYKAMTKDFRDVSAVITMESNVEFFESYDAECERRVNEAIEMLASFAYTMHPMLKFKYGFFENRSTLAKINRSEATVYISNLHAQRDLFDISTTLVEENEHYKTGFADHTREFQQHFINLFVNQLVQSVTV